MGNFGIDAVVKSGQLWSNTTAPILNLAKIPEKCCYGCVVSDIARLAFI
jgi:hypothetical protein